MCVLSFNVGVCLFVYSWPKRPLTELMVGGGVGCSPLYQTHYVSDCQEYKHVKSKSLKMARSTNVFKFLRCDMQKQARQWCLCGYRLSMQSLSSR